MEYSGLTFLKTIHQSDQKIKNEQLNVLKDIEAQLELMNYLKLCELGYMANVQLEKVPGFSKLMKRK